MNSINLFNQDKMILFTETLPCESFPCQNGATCFDNEAGFTCQCTEAFTGVTCADGRAELLTP